MGEKNDENEPTGIQFLGGRRHLKKIADTGQNIVEDLDEIYHRISITLSKNGVEISKDFLVCLRSKLD